jgi:hypothetical protein
METVVCPLLFPDETTSHSTKHDKAVQVAGYASVDVKRVGPAPGEPDQL